ncbi:hypothetical protein lerEdw1_013037 [Lerista edwardsae]|nr:hypothetical protein lerEdw1_013037 [Lerista edwardsae]
MCCLECKGKDQQESLTRRMNSALYLCLVVGLASVAHSHHHHNGHENKHNVTDVSKAKLYPAILDFGIKMYKQCVSTSPGNNIFFSPISISTTLALLSLGAGSVTHTQILEGLGFNLTEIPERDIHEGFHSLFYLLTRADDQILIDIGQALFIKEDLKPLEKFLHDVNDSYDAEVSTVNFQEPSTAEKVINDYVEKKTHGKITELVKSLDPATALVIINYIFFKGNWKKPFDPKLTKEQNFFVNNETTVKVPMMFRLGWFKYYFDTELSCTVLQMDYNSSVTALFILPDQGKLKQVEDALSVDTVKKWTEHMHQFTISTTHELKEPLSTLGIDVFSDQTDLSRITGARDLKVSKVTHKAVLTVNEKGTEAAVAHSHHHHHHHNGHENKHNITNVSKAKLYPAILDFGIKIYKQCASTSPGNNIFFSPISISTTLALLSLGARSVTHTQILEGLGFNLTEIPERDIHEGFHSLFYLLTRADDQILIEIGQALFIKEDLKPLQTFLNDVNDSYDAEVSTVNFQEPSTAAKVINDYVEKKTHGKITELVKGLDPETALVIVNYIFFKGNWKKPFDPTLTREEDFFVNNETTIKIPMMFGMGWFKYYFDAELSCTVLQMDYNSSVTALFILPDQGKLKQVEDALSVDTVKKWTEHVRWDTADVYIPRFMISTTHELMEPLSTLGIDVFSDQTDLSGITGVRELKVSKVTHKAVLTVNEKGTEAAAATAVEMIPLSLPPTISFNRAFFMMISESSKNIPLFIGKIINPALP